MPITSQAGLLAGQAAMPAQPQGLLGFLQNMSPEMKMGLLQAGLGIMANNTGHYGAAGPAIGKGGLIGAQGYNDAVKLKLLKEQQAADEEYRKRKLGIEEGDLDLKRQDANRELSASDALSRALEATQPQAIPQPVVPGAQQSQFQSQLGFNGTGSEGLTADGTGIGWSNISRGYSRRAKTD